MNDDNFIDNALKEHARLEGNDDQDFLDQLEAEISRPEEVKGQSSKKKRSKNYFWPTVGAAAVAVSGVAIWKSLIDERTRFAESSAVVRKSTIERDRTDGSMLLAERAEVPGDDPLIDSDSVMPPPVTAPLTETKGETTQAMVGMKTDNLLSALGSGQTIVGSDSARRNLEDAVVDFGDVSLEPIRPEGDAMSRAKLNGRGVSRYFREDMRGRRMAPLETTGLIEGRERVLPAEKYGALIETGFLSPLSAPLSTFSTDVDTASYTNIRRHIMNGQAIHPDAVRIEEMINYFEYQYAGPEGEHPFAVHTEVASCPWNANHRLVKIGLQGEKIDKGERKAANLVFLLDVSGSMKSADKLPLLVQSFQILLKQLDENDRVSLVVYAGRQAVLLNPTAIDEDGRTQVSQALRQLSAGGSTAGAAGIKTAYELARKGFVQDGVNRVILATDGDFNVGTTNHEELLKLVKSQADGNISLTVLGFGQGNLNDEMMEKLTNSGDGNYFYIDSLREGQKVFQQGLTGTIQTIAKDVKIQVEFNPGKVGQYRLIGYANRRLKDEDFKNDKIDAGDIGAGHRVTALYEIIPSGVAVADGLKYQKVKEAPVREIVASPEMLTVKLRYKQPDGETSTELSRPLTDQEGSWEQASQDFKFSSSVALWGMLLRNSGFTGNATPDLVNELALSGRGDDPKGERAEMIDLVRRWSSIR